MVPPSFAPPEAAAFYSEGDRRSSHNSTMDSSKIIEFVKEYRVLECTCCSTVFGFQHRSTGALYCISGCHEKCPPSMTGGPALPVVSRPLPLASPPVSTPNFNSSTLGIGKEPVMIPTAVAPKATPMAYQDSTPKLEPVQTYQTHAAVDSVDGARNAPKMTAQMSAAKPSIPISHVPAAPAAPSQPPNPAKGRLWSDCIYSPNLKSNEPAHVLYMWNPTVYLVQADCDEPAVSSFQAIIKKYAEQATYLTRPPEVNEMVIAKYEGDFYRAKVKKVTGDECDLTFVDYGDKRTCKYTEAIPVNDEIMKSPVFGLTIHLDKLPTDVKGVKLSESITAEIYENAYILDMANPKPMKPGDAMCYEARLWDSEMNNTLNETIRKVIAAGSSN